MSYNNMAAAADKWLRQDGSVTTMTGERVLPPDPARAALYENMTPNVAKWLLPDGSIVNVLPVSGGGSEGGAGGNTGETEKRPTIYNATCSSIATIPNKILSGLPENYMPHSGDFLLVQFTTLNATTNCTFTFGNDVTETAYTIKFNGLNTNGTASAWKANSVLPFYFDGTNFHQLCYAKETDDNTTYSNSFFEQHLSPMKMRINADRDIMQYQLVLERADTTYDTAIISTTTSSSKAKEVNTYTDFKIDGMMWFYYSNKKLSKNSVIAADSGCLIQSSQSTSLIYYGMNGADNLQADSWIYLVGIPQDDPMVFRLDSTGFTSWYTTTKPTTEDGKVYIRLGYYCGGYIGLIAQHPAYWFKNGYFRPYLTT